MGLLKKQIKRSLVLVSSLLILTSASNAQEFKAAVSYGKTHSFTSTVLGDQRQLQIYLPESYEFGKKEYPVIYVLDGGFLFEPAVVISKVRASRDLMPESIIVGLPNPSNRMRFGMGMPKRREPDGIISFPNGKPMEFLSFLEQEVVSHVDENYRTANHRTLVGMSPTAGPVIAAYINGSKLFTAYVAFAADADFYLPDNTLIADKLIQAVKDRSNEKSWFYVSRGSYDMPHKEGREEAFTAMANGFAKLEGKNHAMSDVIADGEHYASALQGFINAFGFIYPESVWRPNYRKLRASDDPATELNAFYAALSKDYGFKAYPAVDGYWMGSSLGGLSRRLLRAQKYDETISLMEWGLSYLPNSFVLYDFLTTAYEGKKDMRMAVEMAKKAMELSAKQKSEDADYFAQRHAKLAEKK